MCTDFQYNKLTGNCDLKNSSTGAVNSDTSMLAGPAVCGFIQSNSFANLNLLILKKNFSRKNNNKQQFWHFLTTTIFKYN
jgi:hypothetical protein